MTRSTYTQHFTTFHWMIQFYSENVIFCMLKKFNTDLTQALMTYSANMIRSLFYLLKKILNFVTSFALFPLLEKCPNTEFFLVRLSRIRTEYGVLSGPYFPLFGLNIWAIFTQCLVTFYDILFVFQDFLATSFFDILFVFLDFTCTLLLMFYFIF